jgi:hypothetical protein
MDRINRCNRSYRVYGANRHNRLFRINGSYRYAGSSWATRAFHNWTYWMDWIDRVDWSEWCNWVDWMDGHYWPNRMDG